jgi:hypothetical protein
VALKYGIDENELFILDTSYHSYLSKIPVIDSNCIKINNNKYRCTIRKNHLQPLQIMYFDKQDCLISYHLNCNVPVFINLKWNNTGNFNSFIPKSTSFCDPYVRFSDIIKYIKSMDGNQIEIRNFQNDDINIVVFWCRFMGRQSRRVVELVKDNLKLNQNKRVKVIFVNVDNFGVRNY